MDSKKLTLLQTIKLTSAILMAASFSFLPLNALGQEEKVDFNLETTTCWEVMLLEEEERAYAFLLIYGYHSGKTNQGIMSGEIIEETITRAFSFCESNPDNPAIEAMALAQD